MQRLVDAWRPLAHVPCLHPPLGLKYRNGAPVEQRPAPRVWPGPPEEESEAIICRIAGVKWLGRLPMLAPLNQETLAEAFAKSFDRKDFR